ncbi:MAG: SDR family oxidoreductase [Alphaproteobacteria bacterium]|nr:SDR family oxidoreductase [Alphaproteobacteria bacterium]
MATGSIPAARHAVVTGGGRGIGAAIAAALAAEGAAVTLLGRDAERLARTAAELQAGFVVADVTDPASLATAFDAARAARGPIEILVNNAGQAGSAPLAKTDDALWQRMIAVNLTGTFNATRLALPAMVAARWGRIVNIASTGGLIGYRYVSAYCAAKHGVVGLTRAAALEVASSGVTVNAVCPGFTETDIVGESIANIAAKTGRTPAQARAELERHNPQGRLIQPAEVAAAVVWLCRPESASVTGQAIAIAGGEVM